MHASIENNRLKRKSSEISLSIVLAFCRLTLHRRVIQGHLPKSFNREDKNYVKKRLTLDFFKQHTSVSLVSLVHQSGRFYISDCYNRSTTFSRYTRHAQTARYKEPPDEPKLLDEPHHVCARMSMKNTYASVEPRISKQSK